MNNINKTSKNKIFNNVHASQNLCESILTRIEAIEARSSRRKYLFSSIAGFVSGFLLIPELVWLYRDFTSSGFSQSFSLIFSDYSVVVTYWRQFVASLAESLPFWSLVASLATITAFLFSIRVFAKYRKVQNNLNNKISLA